MSPNNLLLLQTSPSQLTVTPPFQSLKVKNLGVSLTLLSHPIFLGFFLSPMSRIWPLVITYTATTPVQATLDHRLWLWLLQSWSSCCHSCLSMVSLWSCKTKVSSHHVCPRPPMALCPSEDKAMPYGTRPLLTLASPPPTRPYLLCFSHTSCSPFPKCSSPENPHSPPPSSIRKCSDVTFPKRPTGHPV